MIIKKVVNRKVVKKVVNKKIVNKKSFNLVEAQKKKTDVLYVRL